MLIGASSGAIQLLKDLGSANADEIDEEYSHIEIPNIKIPKIEIPKIEIPTISFAKLRTKTHKPIKDVEGADSLVEEQTETLEDAFKNEKPEEIIDSLFAQSKEQMEDIQEEPAVVEHKVDPDEYALYKKYLS